MKKKFLAVLLSASMAATVLAGCGGSDSGTTSDQGAADAAAGSEAENADAQSGDEAGADDSAQADQAADAQTDAGEETKGAGDAIVTEPTELTYIFADGDEGAKASMNEIVEKFNETYPDITVTIRKNL